VIGVNSTDSDHYGAARTRQEGAHAFAQLVIDYMAWALLGGS